MFRTFRRLVRLLLGPFPRALEFARSLNSALRAQYGQRHEDRLPDALERVSKVIREHRKGGVSQGRPGVEKVPAKSEEKPRTKITVIAWDLGHNPLGRAYLLADVLRRAYDVELLGTSFPRFGEELWEPLRGCSRVTVRGFPGGRFPSYFNDMEQVVEQIDGDVIYVSKPRLPGLELAILAKLRRNRPIVLDIDDYELGFFEKRTPLTLGGVKRQRHKADFLFPHDESWTRFSETLIPLFEQVTVSNRELQKRYGGLMLPHVRDECEFDPGVWPRDAIRAALGFSPGDKVVLFAGTPRVHKGVAKIAPALKALNQDNCKFLIVGSPVDSEARRFLSGIDPAMVKVVPNVAFADLPAYLCAGDLVCLLQQKGRVVSRFQMPAKFTDALAMGIPILSTGVPLFANLAKRELVELLDGTPLDRKIKDIFDNYPAFKQRAIRNREVFLREYSYAANLPRLTGMIDRLLQNPAAIPNAFRELIDYHRKIFPGENSRPRATVRVLEGGQPACLAQPRAMPVLPKFPRVIEVRPHIDAKIDIVFFWKQNDTGIYGRRQDMLVKYLARDTRIARIFHFDAPIGLFVAGGLAFESSRNAGYSQARLILLQTLSRKLGFKDRGKVRSYTFLYLTKRRIGRLISRIIPSEQDYLNYLERTMRRQRLGQRRTVFWVCPNNFDFPSIEERFRPDLVVSDVIDDQRAWPCTPEYEEKLRQNYADVLGRSHLAFANCRTVFDGMRLFTGNIHLFPNAAEIMDDETLLWKKPAALKRMEGPVIGYVGNLDIARIDLGLLTEVATQRPDWNLAFIGSTHRNKDILELDKFRNVHFLGVRPYGEAVRYIRHFDVAMVPHLDNELTRHMNPLKLYVYFSMYLPIVTTPIANIDKLDQFVQVARTPKEFIERIEHCLEHDTITPKAGQMRDWLVANSWQVRVTRMLALVEAEFTESGQGSSSDAA